MAEAAGRPALGIRFATKLPNASNESGLGLDTTDFYVSLLGAKTVQSIRVVGNLGVGILADPTNGHRQNDVLTYGLSFARAMTQAAEIVGELNGRLSTRERRPVSGHRESRAAEARRPLHARPGAARRRPVLRADDDRSDDRLHRRLHLRLQRVHGAVDRVARTASRPDA